jgi:hypothetical protein
MSGSRVERRSLSTEPCDSSLRIRPGWWNLHDDLYRQNLLCSLLAWAVATLACAPTLSRIRCIYRQCQTLWLHFPSSWHWITMVDPATL